jgi:DNA modification methylase
MNGDTTRIFNSNFFKDYGLGRFVKHEVFHFNFSPHPFWNSDFFHKYLQLKQSAPEKPGRLGDDSFSVLNGDSFSVLKGILDNFFDGAVTSPPYYNAKEYSQWPNIFCYLHDMFNINREVFRTLKPGSIYLFNIFDYFDNEKIVALSAMGQKRMILSAYIVDLFRRIGFVLYGNIVWDKGEIEGKRAFNAGNFSPFYQSPLNCWEHIFIFYKPTSCSINTLKLESRILPLKPVLKMVRGQNTHGHTAPFPDQIPELLISHLLPSQRVLDPFAGSLTTGRVAKSFGCKSTCIEMSLDYCKLGLKILKDKDSKSETLQLALI